MQANDNELQESVMQGLLVMAEILANPKRVSPELVQGWTMTLAAAGVTPAEVSIGVGRLLQTATFFPTPADFLKAVRPPTDQEATEELAWQNVLSAIRRFGPNASLCAADFGGDGACLWALDRMGWDRLCAEMTTDKLSIWRAEFVRIYRAGKGSGERLEYVAGRMERENALRNHELQPALLGVMVGRPDWKALPRGHRLPALAAGDEWAPLDKGALSELVEQLATEEDASAQTEQREEVAA